MSDMEEGERECPLSDLQQRLWFTQQLDPDNPVYNQSVVLTPARPIEIPALERAFKEIVRRHGALRARFEYRHGTPVQIVSPAVDLAVGRIDLTGLPPHAQPGEVQRIVEVEARTPFDLTRAPLVRACLLSTADGERIVLTVHHIVWDGGSHRILVRELGRLYRAFVNDQPSPLPELAPTYSEVMAARDAAGRTSSLSQQLDYWNATLAGAGRIDVAAHRARPVGRSRMGAVVDIEIPAAFVASLRLRARRERVSLFMMVLSAFVLLLHRYTGEDDIVIGTAVMNRNDAAVRDIIGFFVNTLPFRVAVEGSLTAKELLGRVRTAVLGALANQDVPFDRLAPALRGARNPDGEAPFGVLFTFALGVAEDREGLEALDWPATAVHTGRTEFDLNVAFVDVLPGQGPLAVRFEYSTDLFDREAIQRMAGHLGQLLEQIAADPETRLAEARLLTGTERRRLLVEANDSAEPYPTGHCLHELVEQHVARTPDAVAAVFGDSHLTYGQLDRRAGRLSDYLRGLGVAPERRVAICVDRSLDLVVGILGILKAGGAYVPLDPEYPLERLRFMLDDCGATVVVTQAHLLAELPATSATVVAIDSDWPTIATAPPTAVPARPRPANLIHVIYTSGSTGRPKGVQIEHRSVVNVVMSVSARLEMNRGDHLLSVTSPSFDIFGLELLMPLVHGAQVRIASRETTLSGPLLAGALVRSNTTVMQATPATWRLLVEAAPDGARGMKCVSGGEVLPGDLARRLREMGHQVWNMCAPTETTIYSTHYRVDSVADPIPIGIPLGNTSIYVLDRYGQPVPVGTVGELFIGGAGVTRGYLGRGGATAEKFVPNAFGLPGTRLYRTGDLARYRADGNVDYVGRADHQVKVRGFRIELGEIEAALGAHPAVQQAVVMAREERPGEKRLVAYIVGREKGTWDAGELCRHLGTTLPAYMVPSAFVALERVPLTPNGKVDRRALPPPGAVASAAERPYVAPRTDVEQALIRIWADVLGLKRVGVTDSFFEIGGDSILSIQVVARAREAGYRLTLKQMFTEQTVSALARVAVPTGRTRTDQSLVVGAVPLTPIQQWFFEQEPPNPHHFNQAVLLELPSDVDVRTLEAAVAALIAHHDVLRLRFTRSDGIWSQIHNADACGGTFMHEDLSHLSKDEQRQALDASVSCAQSSLNISTGPLLRVVHYDLGSAGARLLVAIHHLAVDGVSWRILLEDLEQGYEQLKRGEPLRLLPKTTSFKEWAERLRAHVDDARFAGETGYWAGEVARRCARVPLDHIGTRNTMAATERVSVSLDAESTRALLQDVPAVYRTHISEVLLAALGVVLVRWIGEPQVVLAVEAHGREDLFDGIDLSRTVGWFTSLYPVVLTLDPDSGTGEQLKAAKEQLRRVPHHGIGYGLLRYVSANAAVREAMASCQPEISFNYLGQFDQLAGRTRLFCMAAESVGHSQGPEGARPHVLDISGMIVDGCLRIDWTYSTALHEPQTISALASSFREALRKMIAHCRSPEAGGYTPSDFPLARLDQRALDRHFAVLPDIEDLYPMSAMQHGLIFHSLYAPESGTYIEQVSCELTGDVDLDAFRRAWQSVVDRQPILRTGFIWEDVPEPLQMVRRYVPLRWHEADWRGTPPAERGEQLAAFLRADRARGFDLHSPPLQRFTLLRFGDETYQFVWSHHHALLDGWSSSALLRDVFECYEAYTRGTVPRFESSPPYHDYIAWLGRQDRMPAERFWRRTLAGFGVPTALDVDRDAARRTGQCDRHDEHVVMMSRASTIALEAYARRHQLTLNTLLQGAWAVLLSRYSGDEDVVFGATVASRPAELPGVETMLGLFINTLPVRVRPEPTQLVSGYLQALQAQQIEARQYDYTPLVDIQRWSELPPGMPLFDTLVVFENYPLDAAARERAADVLGIVAIRTHEQTNYPLTLLATPGAQLPLAFRYDLRRFSRRSVERIAGHLTLLLEDIAGDTARRVMDLRLETEAERRRVLGRSNRHAEGEGARL